MDHEKLLLERMVKARRGHVDEALLDAAHGVQERAGLVLRALEDVGWVHVLGIAGPSQRRLLHAIRLLLQLAERREKTVDEAPGEGVDLGEEGAADVVR